MEQVYQALITLDGWTFLAQICNLMIQMLIFKKFLLNPVKKVIADRKAKADSEIADAKKLREEAEAMKAEADIAQERKKAVNEVKDEIGGIAMEIASKVVEREIREEDHKDLIDEFIKNVGEAS